MHHPVRHLEGEISFCAYNTGIGWRNIIEHMHQNATVAQWYKDHGRHEVMKEIVPTVGWRFSSRLH